MTDPPQYPEAELARLADGTLPAEREAELRAELERSPELTAALSEQRRAVSLLSSLDTPAPDVLRARIEAQTDPGFRQREPDPRRRWRPSFVLPAATALAILVAAIVIAVGAGGSGSAPTLPQTVRVTLAAATLPAPPQDASNSYELTFGVQGTHFPDWERTLGWKTSGARLDKLGDRAVATVFYDGPHGHRVGYAIVSGAPVRVVGGTAVAHAGVTYTLQRHGATRLITWERSGHTCVIAGRGVGYQTLLALATGDTL
ncbi:MAG: hypothetical protein WAK93_14575 [Solirubrobacteraceae bacterium]